MRLEIKQRVRTAALPYLNDRVAEMLRKIATDGPADRYFGICGNLSELALEAGLPQFNAYEFVASLSETYAQFDAVDNALRSSTGLWGGVPGEFRRCWCRLVAAMLDAGEIAAVSG